VRSWDDQSPPVKEEVVYFHVAEEGWKTGAERICTQLFLKQEDRALFLNTPTGQFFK
jgi:hypothetical protein